MNDLIANEIAEKLETLPFISKAGGCCIPYRKDKVSIPISEFVFGLDIDCYTGKLYSFDDCIGAMLIASALEREGIIYTYIKWVYNKGEVHINNKLYEVSAFDLLDNPFDMTMQRATFFNKVFPKQIRLTFTEIF